MSMTNEEYQQLLEAIDLKYEIGTEWTATPSDGESSHEKHYPEKGYVVVYPNQLKEQPCDWCGDRTTEVRTYSRAVGSKVWKAKCHDKECKLKCTIEQKNLFNPLTQVAKE